MFFQTLVLLILACILFLRIVLDFCNLSCSLRLIIGWSNNYFNKLHFIISIETN